MSRLFSRRRLLAAGGIAAVTTPLVTASPAAAATTAGTLKTLLQPMRVFDSRRPDNFFGRKLSSGDVVAVTVSGAYEGDDLASAVFVNVTITDTEGAGYLSVVGDDLSGNASQPSTSNINWSTSGQTLANLTLSTVGGEHAIAVWCAGFGSAHVVVDVFGYVPFTG
jgi:hypothetical protein